MDDPSIFWFIFEDVYQTEKEYIRLRKRSNPLKREMENKLIKTIGSSHSEQEIAILIERGRQKIRKLEGQQSLFIFKKDTLIESFVSEIFNAQIKTIGPDLVFGKIYNFIGYNQVDNKMFRHW